MYWKDGCFDLLDAFRYIAFVGLEYDVCDGFVGCVDICWVGVFADFLFYVGLEFVPVRFVVIGEGVFEVSFFEV